MPHHRSRAYAEPAIYDSSARIYSLRDGYEIKPVPEHLRAKPDQAANWIAAGLIAFSFGVTVLSIYAVCLAVKWLALLMGGVS